MLPLPDFRFFGDDEDEDGESNLMQSNLKIRQQSKISKLMLYVINI